MSSMTIDQLKKSLTEQGITLPPSRSKKADYVKLYKQYSTINDSLGDVYSSDDENPPRTGSQNVTSSSSPSKPDNIEKEVEQMSDDELYHRLREFDDKIGPVLKNTRRVYEKKLIKMLTSGKQSNGYESSKENEKYGIAVDEFSDNDADVITQSVKRSESKERKSLLRDSPKPSAESSFKPETEKSYTSTFEFSNRSSTPGYSNEAKSSRFSYIETIPKGSTYSYIEPDPDIGFASSDLRQRFTDRYDSDKLGSERYTSAKVAEDEEEDDVYRGSSTFRDQYKPSIGSQFKSGLVNDNFKTSFGGSKQYKPSLGVSSQYKSGGLGEHYTGTWEPNINRYLNTGAQKKVSLSNKGYSIPSWFKNVLAALLLFAILVLLMYIYHQWSTTDPYKMIEEDAEKTLQELSEGSGQ